MHLSITMPLLAAMLLTSLHVGAGEADVINVEVDPGANRTYHFHVTVSHTDTGWQHYANQWEIIDQEGNTLATRVLHHPHVNEQPFTRSLTGVSIPDEIKTVRIRAHDSVHAYGGAEIMVTLP